jgi:hypothetical protein
VSSTAQIKASIARGIRSAVLEQMPGTCTFLLIAEFFHHLTIHLAMTCPALAGVIAEIMPKKSPVFIAKWYVRRHHYVQVDDPLRLPNGSNRAARATSTLWW